MNNFGYFTAAWCSRISGLDPTQFPDEVWQTYHRCLIDYMGALIGGSSTELASKIHAFISTRQVPPSTMHSSSVIGIKEGRTHPEWAAFANAAISHAREIDDSHRYVAGLHPGSVIFSVALSLVEAYPETKERFVKSVIAGYETACAIGRVMNPEHRNRSFHSSGTINTLGAAACAGIMLDLDSVQLQSILGLSASMASGIFSFLGESPDVKRLHVAHAAWAGVLSALLVQSGLEGPRSVLEHKEGFIHAFAPESYQQWMFDKRSDKYIDFNKFEIINVYFKPWEACGHAFATIDACLKIRKEILQELSLGKERDELEQYKILYYLKDSQIFIESYKAASVLLGEFPNNIEEAQFHLPFLAVSALVYGDINLKTITKALQNESIRPLIRNVHIKENPNFTSDFPKYRSSEVTIIKNQKKWNKKVVTHLGTPENPMSAEQLMTKFMNVTFELIEKEDQKRIIQDLQKNNLLTINVLNKLLKRERV